jgi:hypothetical protein
MVKDEVKPNPARRMKHAKVGDQDEAASEPESGRPSRPADSSPLPATLFDGGRPSPPISPFEAPARRAEVATRVPPPFPSPQGSIECPTLALDAVPEPRQDVLPRSNMQGEQGALVLKEFGAALFMDGAKSTVLRGFDVTAFQHTRNDLLTRAGSPTDPVEIMLLETLLLTFQGVGKLHVESANAPDVEVARGYGALAVAFTAELRRLALAVQSYRGGGCRDVPSTGETGTAPESTHN